MAGQYTTIANLDTAQAEHTGHICCQPSIFIVVAELAPDWYQKCAPPRTIILWFGSVKPLHISCKCNFILTQINIYFNEGPPA